MITTFEQWWSLIEASGFARGKEGEAMKAAAHDAWKEAQKQEREACAKVCENDESGRDSGGYFAEIIRERSNKPS